MIIWLHQRSVTFMLTVQPTNHNAPACLLRVPISVQFSCSVVGDLFDFGDSRTGSRQSPQSCGKYMNTQASEHPKSQRRNRPNKIIFTHTYFLCNLPVYESSTTSLSNNSSSDYVMPYCAPAGCCTGWHKKTGTFEKPNKKLKKSTKKNLLIEIEPLQLAF